MAEGQLGKALRVPWPLHLEAGPTLLVLSMAPDVTQFTSPPFLAALPG